MKKKKLEMKVTYHYIEPKTEEEKKEQMWLVDRAFDVLFEATLQSDKWKQYKAKQKKRAK